MKKAGDGMAFNKSLNQREEKAFFISTHGCQMNVHDTERMHCLLEMSGWTKAPSAGGASLIIINSCSIREKPVQKVRSEMGRYRQMKKTRPQLTLGVAGCVAQQERGRLFEAIPGLDFVLGTDALDTLPSLLEKLGRRREKTVSAKLSPKTPYHIQTLIKNPKITAFVNISKGCDNFCSFCVVPFTRGREVSRPLNHILQDAEKLYERGVQEITLLGQNVNSYRSPCGADFARLLAVLARRSKIQRIRFTTPHPKDFNESLVDVMQAHRDKIMCFIHLPAQSGNTEVLKRMGRGYSRRQYIRKARMIQKRMPGAVLSTDMIVGFPGETKKEFQDTMSLLDEIPLKICFHSNTLQGLIPRPGFLQIKWKRRRNRCGCKCFKKNTKPLQNLLQKDMKDAC